MSNLVLALVNVAKYHYPLISFMSLKAILEKILSRYYNHFLQRLSLTSFIGPRRSRPDSFINQSARNLRGTSFVYSIGGYTVDPGLNCRWLVLVLRGNLSIQAIIANQLIIRGENIEVVGSHLRAAVIQPTGAMVIGVTILVSIIDTLITKGILGI